MPQLQSFGWERGHFSTIQGFLTFFLVRNNNCNFQEALKVLARRLGSSGKCLCSKVWLGDNIAAIQ